ncbi:MAG: hypothetical protein ACI3XI_03775 [Eubacteriales bacterium]
MNNLPKNNPQDIGRDKNITSMSETSGMRGDVSSKIGVGIDAHFETAGRRRHPRANPLFKAVLVYLSAALLVIGILVVVSWRLAEIREDGRAEVFIENYIETADTDEWRQQLRLNLPNTYPAYEDASKLAYDVLSPALELGKITYLRCMKPSAEGYPVYELFSDGRHFASLVLKDNSIGLFSSGEWEIERMEFNIEYFSDVDFPEYRIIVPSGAALTVNGVEIDPNMKEKHGVSYPALSDAEKGNAVAPCDIYVFNDIYFVPELSARLGSETLRMQAMGEREWFFYYPESAMHEVRVTVPVGVDAYIGGIMLTEEWATREEIDGELGDLDDGGTGTLPRLSVWTVGNIFGEVEVEAKIDGKSVELLSSENRNFIFATPDECKYTVTVIVPADAELFVNGKKITPSLKVEGGATAEDIADGATSLGRYEVSELGVVEGAVPSFDKYVLNGYLAQPNVTAKLGSTELTCAGTRVEGYRMRCDFDYSAGEAFDSARIAEAEKFAEAYIAYICGGGAWLDPSNKETFKANYDAIKAMMIEGTAGYVAVMESYREVNLMPKYDRFTVDGKQTTDLVSYTDKSISCRVEFTVTRTRTVDGVEQTDTLTGSISVLQVYYHGEWRVWSFIYEV